MALAGISSPTNSSSRLKKRIPISPDWMMMVFGLIPNGFYQLVQSVNYGTWYARSAEGIGSPWMMWAVWLRIPGDIVFTLGAIGIMLFTARAVYAILQQPTELGTLPVATPVE